jgi:hypothetical protein
LIKNYIFLQTVTIIEMLFVRYCFFGVWFIVIVLLKVQTVIKMTIIYSLVFASLSTTSFYQGEMLKLKLEKKVNLQKFTKNVEVFFQKLEKKDITLLFTRIVNAESYKKR